MRKKVWSVVFIALSLIACQKDPEALHKQIIRGNTDKIQSLLSTKKHNINSRGLGGETPLMTAAKWSYPEMIQLLISHGANISTQSEDLKTALFYATEKGRLKNMSELIKQGAKIDTKDVHGNTPLMSAIKKDKPLAAKLLIEKGADSNAPNLEGKTPLSQAMDESNLKMAKFLIENGANINYQDSSGVPPLLHSISAGNLDSIRFLLTHNADPNLKNNQKNSALMIGIQEKDIPATKILLDYGAEVNPNQETWSPLNQAVFDDNISMVQLLLDHGAKINFSSKNGWTPLTLAVFKGNSVLAEFLIKKGADINIPNQDGWTPISLAVLANNLSLTENFLNHGADTTIANKEGWCPLSIAIKEDNNPMVERLLSLGVATENKNSSKALLPLQVALTRKNILSATYLIEHNPSLIKTNAWNLLELAIKSNTPSMFQFLIDHGANIDHKNDEGVTPLFLATQLGRLDIVQGLAKIGANIDTKTSEGISPLILASQKGELKIVEFLLTVTRKNNIALTVQPEQPAHKKFFTNQKTSEALKKHYSNLVQEDKRNWTALMIVIEAGDFADFNKLQIPLSAANHKTPYGITPLMIAAQIGSLKIIKELLNAGADPKAANQFIRPSLLAELFGNYEAQKLLAQAEVNRKKININHWGNLSRPILNVSKIKNKPNILSELDINARDKHGFTPLIWALKSKNDSVNQEIIKRLLNHGADPNLSISTETVLMITATQGYPEIISLLLSHGAKINAHDKYGNTALMFAVISNNIDSVKVLINRGAGVKQTNQNGFTALQLSEGQNPYIKQLIEEAWALS